MLIPVARVHHLTGHNPVTIWRKARRGDFGPITFDDRGRQAVAVANVERATNNKFSAEQVARALAQPSNLSPRQKEKARKARQRRMPDPGWIAHLIETRDMHWRQHLITHGELKAIEVPSLPVPKDRPAFSSQDVFTRQQVLQMIERAITQRDDQWWDWCSDPMERAQFPEGPPAITID